MIWMELKRLFAKAPLLVLFVFIIPFFVVSAIITPIHSPQQDEVDTEDWLNTYSAPLSQLVSSISAFDESSNHAEELAAKFEDFSLHLGEFYTYGVAGIPSIYDLRSLFTSVNDSFRVFANEFNDCFSDMVKVYIKQGDYDKIRSHVDEFSQYTIWSETYNIASLDGGDVSYYTNLTTGKLHVFRRAWDKIGTSGGKSKILVILQNASDPVISQAQKDFLLKVYKDEVEPVMGELAFMANQAMDEQDKRVAISRYAGFCAVGYEYIYANLLLSQDENFRGDTSEFFGFKKYSDADIDDRIVLLEYLVSHGEVFTDYSSAFAYGKIMHEPSGTTPLDFVFNNLENLAVFLIVFAIIITIFCIFSDIKNNTVVAAIISKPRWRVIGAKLCAVAICMMFCVMMFFALFYTTAGVIAGWNVPPKVLTVFCGNATVMSPWVLTFIYLCALMFKIMFFALVTAMLCLTLKSSRAAFVVALIICAVILSANFFLSPFAFYQFVPLVALDFGGYFGISYALCCVAGSSRILLTLPLLCGFTFVVALITLRKFIKKDF